MTSRIFDYVFFDSGGTLYAPDAPAAGGYPSRVQSSAERFKRLRYALAGYGVDAAEEELEKVVAETEPSCQSRRGEAYTFHDLMLEVTGALGLSLGPEICACLADSYAGPRYSTWLYPGTLETIRTLYEAGVFLGTISNTSWPGYTMDRHFHGVGLLPFFKVRVYSGDVGIEKPDPGIFRIAEELAGCGGKRILYVGDSPECDVRGAHSVGWKAAFRKNEAKDCDEADYTITETRQLLSIVLGQGGNAD